MGACTGNQAVGTSIVATARDGNYPAKFMVDDALRFGGREQRKRACV